MPSYRTKIQRERDAAKAKRVYQDRKYKDQINHHNNWTYAFIGTIPIEELYKCYHKTRSALLSIIEHSRMPLAERVACTNLVFDLSFEEFKKGMDKARVIFNQHINTKRNGNKEV